ncbi:MAG: DUF192 domain-containing protein [Deltaproteobacteria bacterium]|nr:DUF192 domain-containing protein [Deltaproteobacteria bacterium]
MRGLVSCVRHLEAGWRLPLACVVAGTTACAQTSAPAATKELGKPQPERERVPVEIAAETGSAHFSAEIADDPGERAAGLMWRTSMKDEEAMIFLFPSEAPRSFWMKNTLISLDMIFITSNKTILGVVEQATPQTESPRGVPGESQYVLEINGGLAKKVGIKAGQSVSFYAPIPSR